MAKSKSYQDNLLKRLREDPYEALAYLNEAVVYDLYNPPDKEFTTFRLALKDVIDAYSGIEKS